MVWLWTRLLCLWLPVNQNANLTAHRIPPRSALCLLTYCDNNLSQLLIHFFTSVERLCVFTYLILGLYALLLYNCLEKEAPVTFLSVHLALGATGDSKHMFWFTVCSNTHAHSCFPLCFDSLLGVWASLEPSWSWESCIPIRWWLCVTVALVCNLLFCLTDRDFHSRVSVHTATLSVQRADNQTVNSRTMRKFCSTWKDRTGIKCYKWFSLYFV